MNEQEMIPTPILNKKQFFISYHFSNYLFKKQ